MRANRTVGCLVALVIAAGVTPAGAQQKYNFESLPSGLEQLYASIKKNLVEAAELMPEADYGFKPAPEVRSFGQLVGHVTNTQYNFCAPVRKDAKPQPGDHEKLATKAELVAALKASVAFCEPAYAAMTPAELSAGAKFGQMNITNGYTLIYNVAHDNEHYGNMVTYLRLKGLTPPSSARR